MRTSLQLQYLALDAFNETPVSTADLHFAAAFVDIADPSSPPHVRIGCALDELLLAGWIETVTPSAPQRDRRYRITEAGRRRHQALAQIFARAHADTLKEIIHHARDEDWFDTAVTKLHPLVFAVYALVRIGLQHQPMTQRLKLSGVFTRRLVDTANIAMARNDLHAPAHTVRNVVPEALLPLRIEPKRRFWRRRADSVARGAPRHRYHRLPLTSD